MNQDLQNTDRIKTNLKDIFYVVWHKMCSIILTGIIAALAVMIATQIFITPKYESTTKMYVLMKQNGDSLTSSDMQTSTLLTKDYAELIKSRTVIETVIAQLNLKTAYEEMLEKIQVVTPSDTRIVTISVTDKNPYKASEIANAIRDTAADHISQVMDTEAINVVEEASIPDTKSSPKILLNGVATGIMGCFFAALFIISLYVSNDTIKSQEDVEHYLGLSTLGSIPFQGTVKKARKKKVKQQKKSGVKNRRG